jgi:GxxExxY protein
MNLRNNEMATKTTKLKSNANLFYPDDCYKIYGILFKVFKNLGVGYKEKHVQRAVAIALNKDGIKFKEQAPFSMNYESRFVGRYFLDFVIEGKIVLELKVGERLYKRDYEQIKYYLLKSGLKLGLLAKFGRNGVAVERVLRPNNIS